MIILYLLIILLIIRIYIDNNVVKTSYYEVESEKIPSSFDGYRIVQLSDLHNKKYDQKFLNKIDKENPNIIIMTGDMVSAGDTDFTNFFYVVKYLSEKYKVYYIKGNHEGRMLDGLYEELAETIKGYGVIILDNEYTRLERDSSYINLYGMWVNQRFYSRISKDKKNLLKENTITKLLGNADKNVYNILLMHTPLYFKAYSDWGADLVFSGHIHGGIINVPFIGGLISPHLELFPKYYHGKYSLNDSNLIVHSGLSRTSKTFRLFNQPEIVVVTLKHK